MNPKLKLAQTLMHVLIQTFIPALALALVAISFSHALPVTQNPMSNITVTKIQDMPRKKIPSPVGVVKPQSTVYAQANATGAIDMGRMYTNLPALKWGVESTIPYTSESTPTEIACTSHRIIVKGPNSWELYTHELHSVASLPMTSYALALDPERQLMYGGDKNGLFTAWDLLEGKVRFRLDFEYSSEAYPRTLIVRKHDRFITAWSQIQRNPHAMPSPNFSGLEIRKVAMPIRIQDSSVLIADSKTGSHILREMPLILSLFHLETLFLVYPNFVYLSDLDLNLKSGFTGDFLTRTGTADETGLLYLAVSSQQKEALWVLESTGTRVLNVPLLAAWGNLVMPPCIGFDHRIFLTFKQHLVVISPLGKVLWTQKFPLGLSGITVTPDGTLVVTTGSEILALNSKGDPRTLFHAKSETLNSRAILNDHGKLLVLGSNHLLLLKPQ